MEAGAVSTEPWTFEVGQLQWLPVPPPSQRDASMRERWVDEAIDRARVTTVSGEEVEADWRPVLASMLEHAPDGTGAVFFAFGVFAPMYVTFDTRSADGTRATAGEWLDDEGAEVDSRTLDKASLAEARLVMRVERSAGGPVSYGVGLFGVDRDLGIAITARTADPVVAGQFADAGISLLESFRRAA